MLDMLKDLQAEYGFAYMLVKHDLAVIDMLAYHVLVMKNGKAVEQSPGSTTVLHTPQDEYTKKLLKAAPMPDSAAQKERRAARHALLAAAD